MRMPSFWIRRRLPNGRESTARLDNRGCVCGVVVVEHFRFELRICRFNHFPSMSCSHWVVVVRFDCSNVVVFFILLLVFFLSGVVRVRCDVCVM